MPFNWAISKLQSVVLFYYVQFHIYLRGVYFAFTFFVEIIRSMIYICHLVHLLTVEPFLTSPTDAFLGSMAPKEATFLLSTGLDPTDPFFPSPPAGTREVFLAPSLGSADGTFPLAPVWIEFRVEPVAFNELSRFPMAPLALSDPSPGAASDGGGLRSRSPAMTSVFPRSRAWRAWISSRIWAGIFVSEKSRSDHIVGSMLREGRNCSTRSSNVSG